MPFLLCACLKFDYVLANANPSVFIQQSRKLILNQGVEKLPTNQSSVSNPLFMLIRLLEDIR